MTDRRDNEAGQAPEERPETIIVPGSMRGAHDLTDEELATEAQQVQDLGSASRSCVAIIAVLLFMALMLCIFLTWAFFFQ